MTEPALKRSIVQEIEDFKAAVENLDEAGFRKEVAKRAAGGNLDLRDKIADIAADYFGDAGRETALQVWEGIRLAAELRPKIEEAKREIAQAQSAKSAQAIPKQAEPSAKPACAYLRRTILMLPVPA
jgi:hypothetical protein